MTIINHTTIHLSPGDALRALLGKAITVATEIDVVDETEVQDTRQTVSVAPLIAPKKEAGATMAAELL